MSIFCYLGKIRRKDSIKYEASKGNPENRLFALLSIPSHKCRVVIPVASA